MTVDQYAICPCGNGKKIKFCKCKNSLPELDRIMTMLDGGQVVPALDRINRVLEDHPDAAWALAIKGRILLSLQEYTSLAENAERFVRLQPTNPLALTQRAVSQLFRDQVTEATESILEALTESNRQVDSFVLEIVSMLAFSLANSGKFLSARAYATLALNAEGFDGGRTAAQVLQELNGSPAVNHLLKALPPSRPRPERVEWAERFDEATGLLRSNRIALAEAKFASLARTYPNEPAILSGLLSCAIWSANDQAQAECLEKLSRCEKLDLVARSKMLASSYLVETKANHLAVELVALSADIQDTSQTEIALQAHSLFAPIPERMLRGFVQAEDDIPPRSAFQILDREVPAEDAPLTVDNLPESMGVILLFGKQTDRAARIEVPSLLPRFVPGVRGAMQAALGELELNEEIGFPVPFTLASEPRAAMINRPMPRGEVDKLITAFQSTKLGNRLAEQPLPTLGKRSLRDVAGDESVRLQREAVMRVLENTEQIAEEASVLNEVRQAAGLESLPPIVVRTSDDVEEVDNADLTRVDCSQLDSDGLAYLMQRSQLIRAIVALRKAATEVLGREEKAEDADLKATAYLMLIETDTSPEDSLKLIGEAKKYYDKVGIDKAQLMLMEVPIRVRMGDSEGFQSLMRTLTTEYRGREEVMAALQQILVSIGLINPDGSPRMGGPAPGGAMPTGSMGGSSATPAQASSGLWTPDGGSPASSAAPANQGGSKLWVPGMD